MYVYTHIWVAHHPFGNYTLPECHWVAQLVFWAAVALVLVEVYPLLCTSSLSVDSLLCNFDKEGTSPFNCHEKFLGVFLLHALPICAQETQLPVTSLLVLWREVFLMRYCICSIVVWGNPPLVILAIFKARSMSDCSSCTQLSCLAIVADMLKMSKKLVTATRNEIWLLPLPYMTP